MTHEFMIVTMLLLLIALELALPDYGIIIKKERGMPIRRYNDCVVNYDNRDKATIVINGLIIVERCIEDSISGRIFGTISLHIAQLT